MRGKCLSAWTRTPPATWSSRGAGTRGAGHWRRCAATYPTLSMGSPGRRAFPVYRCLRHPHSLRRARLQARFLLASAAAHLYQPFQWRTTAVVLTTIDTRRRLTRQRVRPLRTRPPHRRGRCSTPKARHLPRRSTRRPGLRRRRPRLRTHHRQASHDDPGHFIGTYMTVPRVGTTGAIV